MQNVLNQAKHTLAETDDTPISERKNQANINDLTLSLDKERAKLILDHLAKTKKEEINNNSEATNEEKEAVIAQVNNPLEFSKSAIDASHDINEINSNKESGITTISALTFAPTVKNDAIQELRRTADSKRAEIDNDLLATIEEKQAAKKSIDNELTSDIAKIKSLETNTQVEQEKTNGINRLNQINVNAIAKNNAKQALDNLANNKKSIIDNDSSTTLEEKNEAKQQVDQILSLAKANIDNLEHNEAINTAQSNAEREITQLQPQAVKKSEAKRMIDEEVNAKNAEIDQMPDATDEEKATANAKVDEVATQAKTNIDHAISNQDVNNVKDVNILSINGIQPVVVMKDQARRAIDAAATAKKAEIDQTPNATDEEKAEAKAKVDETVTKAKGQIDQATNDQGVDEAKTQGTEAINQVQPTVVKKDEVKHALDEVATAKKAEIDKTPNATDEEKAEAKAKVDEAVTKAKGQIDQATNNQSVDEAKTQGIESIKYNQR